MQRLERVDLCLAFEGDFDVLPSSFGAQWGDIPGVLADASQVPRLKEVNVWVCLKLSGGEDGMIERRTNAEAFLDNIRSRVYPPWFLPLKQRQEQGDLLEFSFETEQF